MFPTGTALTEQLSKETLLFGLRVWVVACLAFGLSIVITIVLLSMWMAYRRWRKSASPQMDISEISFIEKEIKGMRQNSFVDCGSHDGATLTVYDKTIICELDARVDSFRHFTKERNSQCDYDLTADSAGSFPQPVKEISPLAGLPGFSFLGWGHWFTLRDLELATNFFAKDKVIGEGGYGIVYHGQLTNGTLVAVKKLLNNVGQAEKEFQVEVEAIGHVHHINLVRLFGYCVEGTQRLLVYEYVNNGNLEQWLHESSWQGSLTWEARIKILKGTANALAYLHEGIEPKVVHRDIKSSNILIDDDFNAKVSDFGLAKLLGAGKSHITTRVMGTFGYVAPEYARTGLLNEKSDVYSFGVVLLEAISGRSPVDYSRLAHEVNLVDWLKVMIASKRSQEVLDPNIFERPSTRALKRALLTALRCIDPDPERRPRMGQVVRLLASDGSMTPGQKVSKEMQLDAERQMEALV